MIVAAKSGVSKEQMSDRVLKGAKYVELHLVPSDIDTEEKRNDIIRNVQETGLEVRVVHTPINRQYKLEGLAKSEGFKTIEETCILANNISKITNKDTHIVIHVELNLEQLSMWGLFDVIKERLSYLLNEYPHIIMDIENETVIELFNGRFEFKNSGRLEHINVCRRLREELKTDRIGLVLDTCHAISTIRLLQFYIDRGVHHNIDLKDYFLEYSEFLNVIHLSNAREFGDNKNHGTGFDTDEEVDLLREMVEYIREIEFNGVLTLEVQEENYLDTKVYSKLHGQLRNLFNIE